jgi:hypothetical protein
MIPSLFNGTIPSSACSAATLPCPGLFGAEFLSLEAIFVANYSQRVPTGYYTNHGGVTVTNVSFCNITATYTHPGQNDTVHVQVWLPSDTWNGRLQHIGGAGWQAGLHRAGLMGMIASVGEGYATIGTDAGLGFDVYPTNWALLSEGNVNLYLLQDLASVCLNDAAIIAKEPFRQLLWNAPQILVFLGVLLGRPSGFPACAALSGCVRWYSRQCPCNQLEPIYHSGYVTPFLHGPDGCLSPCLRNRCHHERGT